MNKELMIKAGFDKTIGDDVLEDSWNKLIKFFDTEENLIKYFNDVAKREKK